MFWTRVFPNNNDAHPIFHPACAILGLALQIPVCLIHAPTVLYRLVLGNIISTKEASIQNLQYRQPCLSMGASTIQISANANQICETRVCQTTSTTQKSHLSNQKSTTCNTESVPVKTEPTWLQTKCIRKTEPAMQNQLFSIIVATQIIPAREFLHWRKNCCNKHHSWPHDNQESLAPQWPKNVTGAIFTIFTSVHVEMGCAHVYFTVFHAWKVLWVLNVLYVFCMFLLFAQGYSEGDWHGTLVGMNFGLTCHYIPAKPLTSISVVLPLRSPGSETGPYPNYTDIPIQT